MGRFLLRARAPDKAVQACARALLNKCGKKGYYLFFVSFQLRWCLGGSQKEKALLNSSTTLTRRRSREDSLSFSLLSLSPLLLLETWTT